MFARDSPIFLGPFNSPMFLELSEIKVCYSQESLVHLSRSWLTTRDSARSLLVVVGYVGSVSASQNLTGIRLVRNSTAVLQDCASYEVQRKFGFLKKVHFISDTSYNGVHATIKTRLTRGSSQAPFYNFCKQRQLLPYKECCVSKHSRCLYRNW